MNENDESNVPDVSNVPLNSPSSRAFILAGFTWFLDAINILSSR
jgi:hypothetical protein